ncbi:2-hydroxyacid dehydrogenase [Alkalilacustris brevis]|uniref:2-hydroxyacid dehydrogenase n=1 Tax=Alkalilacustris brevis TaxID=2026338 RepID=UPI000E0DBE96|nr:glyoxylate/hydroxypyruvate reductase A [Alkalilacustris brevis]
MSVDIYFAANPDLWPDYATPLRDALREAGVEAELLETPPRDPAAVDYIIYSPDGVIEDFSPYTGCKAVLNLWAGVEKIVNNPTLTQPLCRMVDYGLTEGMVEYVTGHVLRYHLGLDALLAAQNGTWNQEPPPLARDRKVAVLGLGALGRACADALARLNFNVTGWSRTPRDQSQITCHAGECGLVQTLTEAEILVLLLPHTPLTESLLNAERLAQLPRGAVVINPGRGALIDDEALIAALDSGHVAHATLDVFRTEPLPAAHPFWAHPRVTVTPHIAAETRPASAARVIAQNILRGETGLPFLHQVDPGQGY